jgi:phage-related protein
MPLQSFTVTVKRQDGSTVPFASINIFKSAGTKCFLWWCWEDWRYITTVSADQNGRAVLTLEQHVRYTIRAKDMQTGKIGEYVGEVTGTSGITIYIRP